MEVAIILLTVLAANTGLYVALKRAVDNIEIRVQNTVPSRKKEAPNTDVLFHTDKRLDQ